jgi:5-methylcytosine-specific restriction endonuclease McrA
MGYIYRPVLVLNVSYEAVNICAARRALVLLLKGKATVEEQDELRVNNMRLPLVIRLMEYCRVPKRKRPLSRQNVLVRDSNTCQYCGKKFEPRKLTMDHVMPKAQGGKNSWENLVAACHPCNHKKGNRTPDEAKMPLLRKPRAVTVHAHRHVMGSATMDHPLWKKYLYA